MKKLGSVLAMGLGLSCLLGCGAGIEVTRLSQEFPVVPLKGETIARLELRDASNAENLGLSMKQGASFVFVDTLFRNADPAPRKIEIKFDRDPALKVTTHFQGKFIFNSPLEQYKILESTLELVPEMRLVIETYGSPPRVQIIPFQGLSIATEIPGMSNATLELVYKAAPNDIQLIPGPSCMYEDPKTRAAGYFLQALWQANLRFEREVCMIEEVLNEEEDTVESSALCTTDGAWIGPQSLVNTSTQVVSYPPAYDLVKPTPFLLAPHAIFDHSMGLQPDEAYRHCERWIR